jgi:hypothetical protein
VVARKARRADIQVGLQGLFYPSTDIARTDYPCSDQYGVGYSLDSRMPAAWSAALVRSKAPPAADRVAAPELERE